MTQGIRKKEDEFKFNKDAGLFVCPAEHIAKRKSKKSDLHPRASARMFII